MSTEDNKALVRRFFQEFWDQKNLAVADELITANHVDHTAGGPPGLPPGPEGLKQFASIYFTAFPDLRITIENMVAEGDKVVTHWTTRGTHRGELMGIPPTGKQVTVTGITIDRIAGGKVAETWTNFDALGMLQQLGVIPSMG